MTLRSSLSAATFVSSPADRQLVKRSNPLVLAVLLSLASIGCGSPSGEAAPGGARDPEARDSSKQSLRILYTADAQGYLEACACETGGMLGGIARRAALVDSLERKDPDLLLLEAGDFATGPGEYGELVGLVAARAMARMGYDAVLPGEVELNLGKGFWEKVAGLELPFVHTNVGTAALGPPQREALVVERGGLRVAILGFVGEDLYYLPETRSGLELVPPEEAAGAALAKLADERIDLVVALVHMKPPEVTRLAERHPGIDVFVAGHTSKDLERHEPRGEALLVSAGFLGQHVGELALSGPDLEGASNALIRLETTLPEDPEIARWARIVAGR